MIFVVELNVNLINTITPSKTGEEDIHQSKQDVQFEENISLKCSLSKADLLFEDVYLLKIIRHRKND